MEDLENKAITLEEIKEMNLQNGTPIEISYRYSDQEEIRKRLAYFSKFSVSGTNLIINYEPSEVSMINISDIEDIKILEYKK